MIENIRKANKKVIILALMLMFLLSSPSLIFATTIVLKSGKSVEGKLIEKTNKYIKIDFCGVPLIYYYDEIENIKDDSANSQRVDDEKEYLSALDGKVSGNYREDQYNLKQDFKYEGSEFIENYFFPLEKAKWNGYEVLNSDWRELDYSQKSRFVLEAIQEIEDKENVDVVFSRPESELVLSLDRINHILSLGGENIPVVTLMLMAFYKEGDIKGELLFNALNHPYLSKQIFGSSNEEIADMKIGKNYIGYICCYKHGNEWLPDSGGPVVGEIKIGLFFAKKTMVPGGATSLFKNYPLNYEYKIIAFREINNFIDENDLEFYYYKVIFEPVRKIF
ncbi:MAG: hypothetical protein NTZ92_06725 [Candidatus Omnitrophica bacterium]|nr:hypothetical protein [Candidatus Omnitrophota bacterium]